MRWLLRTTTVALAAEASALTITVPVTAEYVEKNPGQFSINAENRDGGLIQYKVTRYLSAPRYLIVHFEVRGDENKVLAKCDIPSVVSERSATYYFCVPTEHLASARVGLSEHGFSTLESPAGGVTQTKLPAVGGEIYQIRLADFAPRTSAGSADAKKR
jgi:hypothetical protein